MTTTVCSSACKRYETHIVAVTLSYILLFLYTVVIIYIYHLHLRFLSRFCSSLLVFAWAPTVVFQIFFIGISGTFLQQLLTYFVVDFLYLYPHGIYLFLVAI